MSSDDRWLLPEGMEEALPPHAQRLERLRRALLDRYGAWGYELVMPPFVEYLESLLTGTGSDLDLQTFKVIDPLTGRLMGVRADMTPQAARIDAHRLRRDGPVRLCYLGTVLRSRAEGFAGSRAPLQVGAELYGHAGVESDLEIIELALETLALTGVEQVHLDLGHVGIFRGLARGAGLTMEQEGDLFDALQRKAVPEIDDWLARMDLPAPWGERLEALARLNGGAEMFGEAEALLAGAPGEVSAALGELQDLAGRLAARYPDLPLHFDLAELRGYKYHTGMVFAAFVPGHGQELARGGRYDDIGAIFGRARPAVGFSADLKTLVSVSAEPPQAAAAAAILAPAVDDPALRAKVRELRAAGMRVIVELSAAGGDPAVLGCDRILALREGVWAAIALDDRR